jgi:putative heme-binding domain-containing protein
VRALSTARVPVSKAGPLLNGLAGENSWTVRYEVLRYFRRAEGAATAEDLEWLRGWAAEEAPETKVKGWGGEYLALDGSYQRAFQDFLMMLAETKTPLPVTIESKWDRVIGNNPTPADPVAVADRIAAVKAELANAKLDEGRLLVQGICLSCHAIGGEGVGFAPPLDGSANRDPDGLLAAIVDPDAAIESVFRSYRVEKKDGTILEGFNQGETDDAITLVLMGGAKQVVPTKEIKTAGYVEGKSVMSDVTGGLTAAQVASIASYLRLVK